MSTSGAGLFVLELGHRRGEDTAAVGVVAAVEPEFGAAGRQHDGRRPRASRCRRAGQSAVSMPAR